MRVVTFRHETEERLGFLMDDQVVDPKRVAHQAAGAAGFEPLHCGINIP